MRVKDYGRPVNENGDDRARISCSRNWIFGVPHARAIAEQYYEKSVFERDYYRICNVDLKRIEYDQEKITSSKKKLNGSIIKLTTGGEKKLLNK